MAHLAQKQQDHPWNANAKDAEGWCPLPQVDYLLRIRHIESKDRQAQHVLHEDDLKMEECQ